MSVEIGPVESFRSRQYPVEESTRPDSFGSDILVCLSRLEDNARGQSLAVFWEREVEAELVGTSSLKSVTRKGFDGPRFFSAYFQALRRTWVTSTDPKLFQAPYRAGMDVKSYRLETSRREFPRPRLSLFIADANDVSFWKTIESGSILRKMLIQPNIERIVISFPPSIARQWQKEVESWFGLIVQVFDRDYVAARRRDRGYGILPYPVFSGSPKNPGGLVREWYRIEKRLTSSIALGKLGSNNLVRVGHEPDETYRERFLQDTACHSCLLILKTCCERRNEIPEHALVAEIVEGLGAVFFPFVSL